MTYAANHLDLWDFHMAGSRHLERRHPDLTAAQAEKILEAGAYQCPRCNS